MVAIVKSAGRTLALLEYMRSMRRPVTLVETARALGTPPSSMSALLKSMVALGYVSFDSANRRYRMTYRVALLGEWLQQAMLDDLRLTDVATAIGKDTGETIIIAQRIGAMAQYVYVGPADQPVRLHLPIGTMRPLSTTATGIVLMTRLREGQIRAIVRRNNVEREQGARHIEEEGVLKSVARASREGFARTDGTMTRGASVIAALLPVGEAIPMAIGVGGPSERIAEHAASILESLARHLKVELPASLSHM